MTAVQTAIYFCAACLVAIVTYGAAFIDSRFTLLLLPPLVAFYGDDSYLPQAVSERLQNPKPVTKVFLALAGAYIGLRLTGCDVDGSLRKVLTKDQGITQEL